MDVELAEVRDFLAGHAPFSELPRPVLNELPQRLSARYYRRGTTLVHVGQANDTMFVLRSGAVDIIDAHGSLVERSDLGTCFGMSSVMSGQASSFTMTATEDSLCLLMPGETFRELLHEQPAFARFFMQQQAGRLRSAVESIHMDDAGATLMKTRVSEIVRRAPVTAAPGASIREVAGIMSDARVSAILVMDDDRLLGIVTDRDLRSKVLAADRDPAGPITDIMTPHPHTVEADALAMEVLMEIIAHGFHHMPVVDGERVVGMVSAGDLMRLEQTNPVYLVGDIANQTTLDGLKRTAARLPAVVTSLVDQDATAEDIGRVVSAVGDALTRRLLNFAEAEFGAPPVRYCWVALGSQGRLEQGLGSDQDSALILADDYDEAHADYFARLTEQVVAGLEACGYPRCPGDMMASNPRWRVPITQWSRYFAGWINEPDPDALLHAQTFFDMRPLYGDNALFSRLHSAVVSRTAGATRFLGHLAKQANDWKPPIGFFRDFVLSDHGEHRNTLDVKAGGVVAVVQIARLLSLSRGLAQINTVARLRAAASAGALSSENAENLVDAFEFINHVRIRHQADQLRRGEAPDNHILPLELTAFDRRSLRDAFQIIRRMQGALARTHQTHLMS
ncbi:DUF294 nucleotidyltransferase-like domain-containing protein [Nigerium massiliense]|uniref:DUF294 nucleotidyltransferase-like domain-containing protein n=1 Tax=Nigerium massiliense TaxID=1522317 RepID=UPI00058F1185|nr:DUF294 nucleotidyltransferase-like domain-containing protein [Nigerium massiliense]